MTTTAPAIAYAAQGIDKETLLNLYEQLVRPRLIEEKMLNLLRQGRISKWFSGIGQEAISVGAACALLPDEVIFTMHRNLGVFTARNMPLDRMFCQWQGKRLGYTQARDRSFHFGAMEHAIVGMISHLGPQLSLAAGVAMAHKLKKEGRVSLAFTGEGATSQGEFHEALNVASVWKLPVIFLIENNGYGLSTRSNEQYACKDLVDRAAGYGMRSAKIDGNNILEVFGTIRKIAAEMRENPEPFLLECVTFRMRGHEEASGTKYVPQELMDEWAKKDPIENFEKWLLEEGVLTESFSKSLKDRYKKEIQKAVDVMFAEPEPVADTQQELADVYAPAPAVTAPAQPARELRFIDAISDALREAMLRHPELVLMGQDIADYGGVFKITNGFTQQFGKDRVRNTPLCESAIVGISLGLSLKGIKSMVEMQFADFVTCGFNQIVNNLAKLHWRWGQTADVVVRMPTGGGTGAGPFHSQSNEAWFTHVPGLKVVYPSTPADAKGLLLAAFEDPNPVMFFEHKALYRSESGMVPEGFYTVEIGKARQVRSGSEVSILTYGMGVRWAEAVADEMGIDADIVDLRSLVPLDYEAITESVKKTNRVLILHEDTLFGGIGGEIAAWISENLFEYLDAPVLRAASLDTPVPFAIPLEQNFFPLERVKEQLGKILKY
ncbi:MAG TPA: dehydrogenase E1 component subunit alpha/beta [Saprospiraceae bacterium]|nr:dehydrogenase E1 component subunit alpha/beta [Saprospiraceae bacterium]HPI07570.1 dehydrogenase E1 component subunit alpha/beta [Saprospiraceae bacterium]